MTDNPSIIVVDLDGTLCNAGHREHLARNGDWDAFHDLCHLDEPWVDVQTLIKIFDEARFTIVGLTGRNERYRLKTNLWLSKHDIKMDDLLMRPDDNYEQDAVLKPRLLDEWLEYECCTHADVLLIMEDRDKMVEAWRNLGHSCWQPRANGY